MSASTPDAGSWLSRYREAIEERTPAERLLQLAEDEDWSIREGVAQNPAAPAEALLGLALDEDLDVRMAAAANPTSPSESLEVMAKTGDPSICVRVVLNPKTPRAARRTAFFAAVSEIGHILDTVDWTPVFEGVSEDEWMLAREMAGSLDGDAQRLEETVAAVLSIETGT